MSLRRNAMPVTMQLPHELSDILLRNGMQATLVTDAQGDPKLMVQGHDSPVLTYNLSSQQLSALTAWGSNHLNKQAYNTFAEIVSNDFDIPKNYVHARNVNSRVAMGLHGYRIGVGEYGREPMMTPRQAFMSGMPMCCGPRQRGFWQVMTPFLGWTARQQDGFHLRRMGGMLVTLQGTPIIPERPDGRMKPGELQSGGYGFYWKGGTLDPAPIQQRMVDPLLQFQTAQQKPEVIQEPLPVRSNEPAKPYNELISSPVYFTSDKFLECLQSHGIIIDKEKSELVIQSSKVDADITYSLTERQMKALSSDSVKEHSVESRLAAINEVIGPDFKDSVTMDMLNGKERIQIDLKPEARAELFEIEAIRQEETERVDALSSTASVARQSIQTDGLVIPLISEKEGMHWQQSARHGRDVVVGNVVAYENEGKCYLHADINGESFTKELTQDEFKEIRYRNDNRRLELIDQHLDGIHLEEGDYKGEVVNSTRTQGDALLEASQGRKGWYREGADGREVSVGEIGVTRHDAKFIMSAEIDGETVSHEISQKDFNKFLQMDDYHRMKLFSKIFDEVDIKSNVSVGTKVGAAVAAAVTVMGEVIMGGEPMVSMPRESGMHGPQPRAYFKPGVDSPMDIAARNFEAAMVTEQIHQGIHH